MPRRIEDLGPVDFSVVECHSCDNVELLSGRFLLSLGFPPYTVLWPRGQRRSRHDRLPEYSVTHRYPTFLARMLIASLKRNSYVKLAARYLCRELPISGRELISAAGQPGYPRKVAATRTAFSSSLPTG